MIRSLLSKNIKLLTADTDFTNVLEEIITKVFADIIGVIKQFGAGLTGLITILCALAVIVLIVQGVLDIMGNGQGNVFAEKGKLMLILVAVGVVAGMITASFFIN